MPESPLPIVGADDQTIRAALEDAILAPLLPALAHLTGDLSLLREDLQPDPLLIAEPQAGFTEAQQAAIRQLAFDTLVAFRDAGARVAPTPSDDELLRIMEFAVGGGEMREYLPLLEEELAVDGEDRRAPRWHKAEVAPDVDFEVVVIGAGMSGLLAGYRLSQVGVPYVILEKNADVGGTWWENTYPGCRVDNPNHLYSYSFAQRDDWPQHFSSQPVLAGYFRWFADEFGVGEHVRFSTEVESAAWSEPDRAWRLRVRSAEGTEETLTAQVVISVVGQLNRPKRPDIPGLDRFEGPSFHSARWDQSVDLNGRRVVVIGTGASAAQFIPIVAEQAGELTVFQRTPPWFGPTPDYHEEVPAGLRWLYGHVPFYSQWYRFFIFWMTADGVLPNVIVDPAWTGEGSVSEFNEMFRVLLTEYLDTEFADRPDLRDHVQPRYPVGAKRILRDNGVWAQTLKRSNVRLVTEGIQEVTPKGVRTVDGEEHLADVIIYGTGFQASKFLTPMSVVGRAGADLHDEWAGDARAYLGMTVPGFPNFFMLYGPNTNIVINGSIVYFSECEVRYVVGCLRTLLAGGHRALDLKPEVFEAYYQRLDEANGQRAWGVSSVNTWYKNDKGRITQNWPFTLLEFWQRTLEPNPEDYTFLD